MHPCRHPTHTARLPPTKLPTWWRWAALGAIAVVGIIIVWLFALGGLVLGGRGNGRATGPVATSSAPAAGAAGADELNDRPRAVLGFLTPREVFTKLLTVTVASTAWHCRSWSELVDGRVCRTGLAVRVFPTSYTPFRTLGTFGTVWVHPGLREWGGIGAATSHCLAVGCQRTTSSGKVRPSRSGTGLKHCSDPMEVGRTC
jgi:hypothetical protein